MRVLVLLHGSLDRGLVIFEALVNGHMLALIRHKTPQLSLVHIAVESCPHHLGLFMVRVRLVRLLYPQEALLELVFRWVLA